MMNVRILTFILASSLFAASDRALTPAERGQSEFDRIALAPAPALGDATACIQTTASLIPLAGPEELPLMVFHKGYCEFAAAAITGEPAAFHAAAADFDKALEAWPGRAAALARRKQAPEPAPSALRVLAQVARLKAGTEDPALEAAARELASALASPTCPTALVPAGLCQSLIGIGRQWQGWIALQGDDLESSASTFSAASAPAWSAWVSGRQAFRARQYRQAADAYQRAVSAWDTERRESPQPLVDRIAPPLDLSSAYTELGGARLVAGDPAAAIAALSLAFRESPSNSRALFLRALAEDAAGQNEAALADYNLASRTAFANAKDLASGEAHLYRGILLFRRKQYRGAEDEFSSALNFSIAASLRGDAIAWRRLSAVAEGSCDVGVRYLEEALPSASPYFPRQEARTFMSACHAL
jgi:tetratricopeptide (TPR) repeat protein